MEPKRIYHQVLARLAGRWPALSHRLLAAFAPSARAEVVPWQPMVIPLAEAKIALVTTAGIHHRRQHPFDMLDSRGDPSFRVIDGRTIADDFVISHDYYDHRDADRDLNVVFPITRLREMQAAGCIGALSARHFAFMGHILDAQAERLTAEFAPQVAAMAHEDQVDAVLLTPA
jgi:D-proline reductase (dithiol) PrdB